MDILVSVVLPVSLAIIMLSLGIGLTLRDLVRVFERGWVFAIGAICQIVLIPVVAYGVIMAFGLSGEMAAGVMLLAFCPGGVTSNVISRLARGDVALSVSLTALVSLLSILTVPVLVGWAVVHFMGSAAPEISVFALAMQMVLLTTLPVALGMGLRAMAPDLADRIEPRVVAVASVLFALIVLAAIATNWSLVVENFVRIGPALLSLNLATMLAGLGVATVFGFVWRERKTISIEVGIQNGTLGIALAPVIVGSAAEIPAIAIPSALYGVVMYLTAFPFVLWLRGRA
jgi:BASS family bile acid:Na+ symporter